MKVAFFASEKSKWIEEDIVRRGEAFLRSLCPFLFFL